MATKRRRIDPTRRALQIAVVNGHLASVRGCLLVGHYASSVLTGTEAVVDGLTGGVLHRALDLGLYPDAPGTHQLFLNQHRDPDNPWLDPRPRAAIVVGLGDEGQLSGWALADAAKAAALAWVARQREAAAPEAADLALSAALMGSGSAAISPADAARALAIGLREANRKLAQVGWPVVERLTLVELYADRAVDAWYGLNVLAQSAPGDFELAPTVETGTGPLRRPLATAYRGTDADLLSVSMAGEDGLAFVLHTDRAATAVRAANAHVGLARQLIAKADAESRRSVDFRRTLHVLLVPPDLRPFLAGTRRLLLEVDAGTAGLPWELLDTNDTDSTPIDRRPWAVRTRVLRQVRRQDHRRFVPPAEPALAALVIGDPAGDPARHVPLPGARAEAQAIASRLAEPGALGAEQVVSLAEGADAITVVAALFERPYRVIHLAGQLALPEGDVAESERPTPEGLVLSQGTVLGAYEIAAMRVLPELVFVSSGHGPVLSTAEDVPHETDTRRAEAAQRLAASLLAVGVRCVVVAGWPVDDVPARGFAAAFYRALLEGQAFVDAVATAREAAWQADPQGCTWAAYQAYGDAHWCMRRAVADAPPPSALERRARDDVGVGSPMQLAVALDAVAVGLRHHGANVHPQAERLRHLESSYAATWGQLGSVAEAFGVAWAACGDRARAIAWFERAVSAADRSATMKSQEQLATLRIREAWARASSDAGARAGEAAREAILRGVEELTRLVAQAPTRELMVLCGSAWRRLGLLELQRGHAGSAHAALEQARSHFAAAMAAAAADGGRELFQPGLSRIALDLMLALDHPVGARLRARIDVDDIDAVRHSLLRAIVEAPDFFTHAGLVELDTYEAVLQRALREKRPELQAAFSALHEKVASPAYWDAAATGLLTVLARYRAGAAGAERAAAMALETLLRSFGAVAAAALPAAADMADVVIWHGVRDGERAQRLASCLAEQGVEAWLVPESAAGIDSTRDAELRYRMERARACVLVFGLDGGPPGRHVQHDWQQLLVAMERPRGVAAKPVLAAWTAGEGELPPFLRDHPRFGAPQDDAAAAAAGLALLLKARRRRPARKAASPQPRTRREVRR